MSRIKVKPISRVERKNVSSAVDEYIQRSCLRNLSPRTIEYYREDLECFIRTLLDGVVATSSIVFPCAPQNSYAHSARLRISQVRLLLRRFYLTSDLELFGRPVKSSVFGGEPRFAGHHQLVVPVGMIDQIVEAFGTLWKRGRYSGTAIFLVFEILEFITHVKF